METYFRKKLELLVSKSGLGREERDFLSEFSGSASPVRLGKICAAALRSDDRDDYFLSLVYGVKLKRRLDAVGYLTDQDRKKMIGLVAGMSGRDAKRLYDAIESGSGADGKSVDVLIGDIRNDIRRTLDVTQRAFTDLMRKRSDEKDHLAIRKIREKLEVGE